MTLRDHQHNDVIAVLEKWIQRVTHEPPGYWEGGTETHSA